MKLSHLLPTLLLSTSLAFASSTEYEEARKLYDNKSYSLAYKKAKPLARKGDADAINLLGEMYFEGKGANKNVIWSIKLFNEAEARGNVDATNNLEVVRKTYRQHLKDYDNKLTQQKLISWLTTIDPEYKDKLMFDGALFNMPIPSKFVNAYPYDKGDHLQLPPSSEPISTISYVLQDDLNNHIIGKESESLFTYQSVLAWRGSVSQIEFSELKKNKEKLLQFFYEEFEDISVETNAPYSKLIIDKDNAFGYFVKVGDFEAALVKFTIKEKLFLMMLANGDSNTDRPVKEDMVEWIDLILEANK